MYKVQKLSPGLKDQIPKKKCINGGYLYVIWNEDLSDYDWICRNGVPTDFATLVRLTINQKMVENSRLHTRTFVSQNGLSLFTVFKGSQQVYRQEAIRKSLNV